MSVKYAFQRGNERLFGTAYEFRNETEKEQVLAALRTALGENVTTVRSFASGRVFDPQGAADWLRANGVTEERAAAWHSRVFTLNPPAQKEKSSAQNIQAPPAQAALVRRQGKVERRGQVASGIDVAALLALRDRLPRAGRADGPLSGPPASRSEANEQTPPRVQEETRKEAIRRIVCERQIQFLMHFTRAENLGSILQRGIVSRQVLGDDGCKWNDPLRLDGRLHANCLSISHPNYKMFWNYRKQDEQQQWVVLKLAPSLLWELDCGFTEINAASESQGVCDRDEENLKSVAAFETMFGDPGLRRQLALPVHYTTNPQAEVLVFESIPTRFIREVCVNISVGFKNAKALTAAQSQGIMMRRDDAVFRYRHDYQHWQKPEWSTYG